jgi:outer membrane protein OmpA-like peptidoglycan-associated protein
MMANRGAMSQQTVSTESTTPAQPSNEYTVYFAWDKYNLNADARTTIEQAAATAAQNKATIVVVTGHTDTTGSADYNQRLSERRANAVKRELVRLGIGRDMIETVAKGKTDLAVQTDDQVRERMNRRAVIVLRIG